MDSSEYPPDQSSLTCSKECSMRINLNANRSIQSIVFVDYALNDRSYTMDLCMKSVSNIMPTTKISKITTSLTSELITSVPITSNPTSIPATTYTSQLTSLKTDSTITSKLSTIETTILTTETTKIIYCPEDCYKSKVLLVPDQQLLSKFGLENDFYKIKNNCTISCK